jgi:GT2 family glycosyltransferase
VVAYIGTKFNEHLARLAQPDHAIKLRDFYGCNFSVRRDVLLSAGLYEEAFRIYGNEDLELWLRLEQAAVKLVYSPDALAYQYYLKDFAALARDNVALGRTTVLMATMHPKTYPDLKLSLYESEWRMWRPLRACLLGFSRLWPGTYGGVISFMRWLERRRPVRLNFYYTLALDYCFWLGVQAVLHENARLGQVPSSLDYLRKMSLQSLEADPHKGEGA